MTSALLVTHSTNTRVYRSAVFFLRVPHEYCAICYNTFGIMYLFFCTLKFLEVLITVYLYNSSIMCIRRRVDCRNEHISYWTAGMNTLATEIRCAVNIAWLLHSAHWLNTEWNIFKVNIVSASVNNGRSREQQQNRIAGLKSRAE